MKQRGWIHGGQEGSINSWNIIKIGTVNIVCHTTKNGLAGNLNFPRMKVCRIHNQLAKGLYNYVKPLATTYRYRIFKHIQIKLKSSIPTFEQEDLRAYNVFYFPLIILSTWSSVVTTTHRDEKPRSIFLLTQQSGKEKYISNGLIEKEGWRRTEGKWKTYLVQMHEATFNPNFSVGSNENLPQYVCQKILHI